tara:strand:+ start:1211 stop:1942 length:732 start_codon:yes stop_codon:yes gene_type:complete
MHRLLLYNFLVTTLIAPASISANSNKIPTYRAIYDVEYKNRSVGESEITVKKKESNDNYVFSSKSNATGFLKLIFPKTLIEVSEFSYLDNTIKPQIYSFSDSSITNSESYTISFNWEKNLVNTTINDQVISSEIQPNTLDNGTLQVALMLDMKNSVPESYTIRDDDGARVYKYTSEGEENLETPLGIIATKKLMQERQGFSHQTIIWLAKDLQFIPVRIEQFRDGKQRVVLNINSLKWLTIDD